MTSLRTPLFLILVTAFFGLAPNRLASSSDTANVVELDNRDASENTVDSVFIPLNEQTEISQDMMKVNDFLPFLSEYGSSEKGYELLYHPEMQDQIVCTHDDTGYHYSAVEGQEEKPILRVSLEEKTDYCYWLSELDPDFFFDLPTAEELKQAGFDEEEGFRIVRCRRPDQSNLARTDAPQTQKFSEPPATKDKPQSKSWWPSWFSNSSTGGVGGAMMVGGGGVGASSGLSTGAVGTATRGARLGATLLEDAELGAEISLGVASLFTGAGEFVLAGELIEAADTAAVVEPAAQGVLGRIGGWMSRTATRFFGRSTATLERSAGQRIATAGENNLPVAQLENTGSQIAGRTRMVVEAKAEDPELQRTMEELDRRYAEIEAETARKAASGELKREIAENAARIRREVTPDHPDYWMYKDLL